MDRWMDDWLMGSAAGLCIHTASGEEGVSRSFTATSPYNELRGRPEQTGMLGIHAHTHFALGSRIGADEAERTVRISGAARGFVQYSAPVPS